MKGSSKILPNNTPLAVAARGNKVVQMHPPKQKRSDFQPWSRQQPKYKKWLKGKMHGQHCQCPDPSCWRGGAQIHHELRGAHKDDRAICWLSLHCHLTIRHPQVDEGKPVGDWSAAQYKAGLRAVAAENWLEYETAMGEAA